MSIKSTINWSGVGRVFYISSALGNAMIALGIEEEEMAGGLLTARMRDESVRGETLHE